MMVRLLNQRGPWLLALDRTNWKVGSRDINILMLALVTRRFRVPLMWMMLDKPGSSNTNERIALTRRYLALFGASSIQLLLADREFIGHATGLISSIKTISPLLSVSRRACT